MSILVKFFLTWVRAHWVDFCFAIGFIAFYRYVLHPFNEEYLTAYVAYAVGVAAWLQFIYYKYSSKKDAALNYFPRPMELERIENEIDKVIGFWRRPDPLHSFEVKLMLEKKITENEYHLIWERLPPSRKRDLMAKAGEKKVESPDPEFKKKYQLFIDETFLETRRKLNLYLNQIENYCLAINRGVISGKVAYELYSHKFPGHFRKAQTYIDIVRKEKADPSIYCEFEKVVTRWKSGLK